MSSKRSDRPGTVGSSPPPPGLLIGSSPAFLKVLCRGQALAALSRPVLLEGPTGSGKEGLARYIHALSGLSGPMLALNCASLPLDIAEAELFGCERGAFTGAHTERQGLVEAAAGGILFLDEVAELPRPLQAKILRFLSDHTFRRLGSTLERTSDARILAATSQDLETLVSQGRFLPDLYYRLAVLRLKVPALHARGRDVVAIARHFLRTDPDLRDRHLELTPSACQVLCLFAWPGNIRQLQSALLEAALLVKGTQLHALHLERVLGWKRTGVTEPARLVDGLTPGQLHTAQELRHLTGLTHGTFYRRLHRLLASGDLEAIGQGNQTRYRRGAGTVDSLKLSESATNQGNLAEQGREGLLLELCDTPGGLTCEELADRLERAPRTISRLVQFLVGEGRLEVLKVGRQRRYRARGASSVQGRQAAEE